MSKNSDEEIRGNNIEVPERIPNSGKSEANPPDPIQGQPAESSSDSGPSLKDLPVPPPSPVFTPPSASSGEQETKKKTTAGLGSRFFALLTDYIILEIFIALGTLPFGEKVAGMDLPWALLQFQDLDKLEGILTIFFFYSLISVAFLGFYFTFFHWTSGQTIGKKFFGIKVVKLDGSPLGFLDALVRWVGFMFGLSVFGLGLLWAIFNKDRRAWHDKMAGTIVVKGE